MDPRHPELSIERIDELMKQYKNILRDMRVSMVSSDLGKMERECGLVVQEICLVAPRLHEAMIQVSRTRRSAIAHGIVDSYQDEGGEKTIVLSSEEAVDLVKDLDLVSSDAKISEDKTAIEIEQVYKPKKKTTRKKKTAKKKEDK